LQKCIFKAALLGLSIAFTVGPITTLSLPTNSRLEVTTTGAQVDAISNALTQEISINSSTSVNRSHMARVSWYRHGTVTANGERFNPIGLTVAHKSLPFNTLVKFTNPETGAHIITRVNDRGPFIKGRDFDLSMGAARSLGILERGVANVIVEIIQENK
jgi:rare lipoprotein A